MSFGKLTHFIAVVYNFRSRVKNFSESNITYFCQTADFVHNAGDLWQGVWIDLSVLNAWFNMASSETNQANTFSLQNTLNCLDQLTLELRNLNITGKNEALH